MSNSLLLSTELCLDTGRPYLFELLILAFTLIGWPGLKGFSSSLMNSLIIPIFFFLSSVTVLLLIFTLIKVSSWLGYYLWSYGGSKMRKNGGSKKWSKLYTSYCPVTV